MSAQRDGDKVLSLSRQYVSRFGNSIFAENFIQGFAAAAVRNGMGDDVEGFRKFEPLLSLLTSDQRRIFMLAVARGQIVRGGNKVAWMAATEAARGAPTGSTEETRAKFYAAAAQYLGPDYEGGIAALEGLDHSKLPRADRALFDAVIFSARHLRDLPSPTALAEAGHEDQVAVARSPNAAEGKNADLASQTILAAERALASASAVGGGAR